jgi:hypothetical protein
MLEKRSGFQEGDLEAGVRLGAFWKDLEGFECPPDAFPKATTWWVYWGLAGMDPHRHVCFYDTQITLSIRENP